MSHLFCFLLFCEILPFRGLCCGCVPCCLYHLPWCQAGFAAGFAAGGVFWWSWLGLPKGKPTLEGTRVRFLENLGVKSQGNLPEKLQPRPVWGG